MSDSNRRYRSLGLIGLLLALITAPLPLAAAEKPSIVIVISVDQMRADYLERFRPYFGADGFNRFLRDGAVFPEARQRYAATVTGPGHAAIGSGLDPRDSGIPSNSWYDAAARREVYCVEDPASEWVSDRPAPSGLRVLPASPVLGEPVSLGDRLKEKFPGARVVGVALKDRAAVLMAGRKADAAIWFEEGFGRFVTSSYYAPHPEIFAFNDRLAAYFGAPEHRSWKLSSRIPTADLDRITFDPPELFDSKNPPDGYGATFPHALENPKAVVASPWGNDLLLDLSRFVIEKMDLGGRMERPDLLFIGLSSPDYYGHWFGPDSKEVADGMVRLDESLQRFFQWLDQRLPRDRILVFLTADHGVQPLPEVTRAKYKARTGTSDYLIAGRVDFSNSRGRIEDPTMHQLGGDRFALEWHIAKTFGYALDASANNSAEGAVASFEEPCFYLNRPVLARRGLAPESVKAAIRDWIIHRPGVLAAFTNTEIEDGLPPAAPYATAVKRSFVPGRSGDVFVVLKPGWMWGDGREAGTTHGQPNDDDARVPLLAWGSVVSRGSWDDRVSPISIARTVGELFEFKVGEPDAEVLGPVLGRTSGAPSGAVASSR